MLRRGGFTVLRTFRRGREDAMHPESCVATFSGSEASVLETRGSFWEAWGSFVELLGFMLGALGDEFGSFL